MKINQEITTDQQRLDLIKELQNLEIKKVKRGWYGIGDILGYYISQDSYICQIGTDSDPKNRNVFATREQAESSLAYAMLTQLMKEANGDWVADWSDKSQTKYGVDMKLAELKTETSCDWGMLIALKSEAIRDEFLENHEELIKTFYQIK